MYTITITHKDKNNKSCVDIFDNVSGISIDGKMIRLYYKDGIDKQYNYENILIVQIVNSKLL